MNRRRMLAVIGLSYLGVTWRPVLAQSGGSGRAKLPSIAVLDFELLDDHNNPATKAAQVVRLHNATLQLRQELEERRLYDVMDLSPSLDLQDKLRSQQEFMYRCDDCPAQIGALLGADLVMMPWVFKMSELILNLNVDIYDVKAGMVIFSKSISMRGNQDQSWSRAVHYLVRGMAEKRDRNPSYGL